MSASFDIVSDGFNNVAEQLLFAVWDLVRPEARGAVLLELSDAVRPRLIADMKENEILGAVEHLESQDIANLVPSLPRDTVSALFDTLNREYRTELQTMLEFPRASPGQSTTRRR